MLNYSITISEDVDIVVRAENWDDAKQKVEKALSDLIGSMGFTEPEPSQGILRND